MPTDHWQSSNVISWSRRKGRGSLTRGSRQLYNETKTKLSQNTAIVTLIIEPKRWTPLEFKGAIALNRGGSRRGGKRNQCIHLLRGLKGGRGGAQLHPLSHHCLHYLVITFIVLLLASLFYSCFYCFVVLLFSWFCFLRCLGRRWRASGFITLAGTASLLGIKHDWEHHKKGSWRNRFQRRRGRKGSRSKRKFVCPDWIFPTLEIYSGNYLMFVT